MTSAPSGRISYRRRRPIFCRSMKERKRNGPHGLSRTSVS